MANWKRHVGMINAMTKAQSKLNAPALIQQQKADRIAQLVEKLKAKTNG